MVADMNTNELRGIADALEIDCIARCADEIDRLTNEAVAADIRIGNDATTIAELQREQDENAQRYMEQIKTLTAERDAARIILDDTSLTLAKRSVERDALRADALRMNWLDNNIYSRENIDLFGKPDKKYTMWVTFAPKGVQGSARAIIDAAMKGQP